MVRGDIQAEVCYHGDKPPEVVLTVLTRRITTPNNRPEEIPPDKVRQFVPEIKVDPAGKNGR